MTTRTGLIAAAVTGLATVLAESQTRCGRAADTTQAQAENALLAGWDGVAHGYESASGHLSEVLSHLSDLEERLTHAVEVLDRVHDDLSAPEVSGHLGAVIAELGEEHLDNAALAADKALRHLETVEAGWLVGVAQDLARDLQESGEALMTIRDDLAEEIGAADALGPTDTEMTPRVEELRRQGHGPQRHGPQVTDQQLTDRVLWWIDPMTGTTVDGDTGGQHRCAKVATKVASEASYVAAEAFIRSSRAFDQARRQAEAGHESMMKVVVPLPDIYGPGYRERIRGVQRNGSRTHPTGDPAGTRPPTEVDFTDGRMIAVYTRRPGGKFRLKTMFPDPRGAV
ncbi:hypothetical protein GCM10022223_37350 [Kineosporia mesophila]|uniref:Bacterial CdiA-CT RNAse A domain-containing protein n=1 Tax=Kineosporia mesophila TaxID=566012 RepID=A0ABP6ZRC6_9ACTN|nr:hypothetical protein [Kineosporia mesophila]MCD5349839.1 hypothetical protein [Kineosporia mesophila]